MVIQEEKTSPRRLVERSGLGLRIQFDERIET